MKHIIFSLFLLTILSGCTLPHIKEAHRVMHKFSDEMTTDDYTLFKSGGSMMHDINIISLGFYTEQALSIEEARLTLLSKANSLIDLINTDLKIRPYLRNYPFTLANINLSIMFFQDSGDFVNPPFVAAAYISGINNKIIYTVYDSNKNNLKAVFKESFEDGVRKSLGKTPVTTKVLQTKNYHFNEKIYQNSLNLRMNEIVESGRD